MESQISKLFTGKGFLEKKLLLPIGVLLDASDLSC